ncbi:MAG TPA: hypothetical protein PKB15_01995 [Acidimicrobiia bacterium]|nr:hypothetical protein [Acidimicrobiia bacterium]
MSRTTRQLVDLGHQIDALRNDLQQSNEQFVALEEMAEDAHIRAIVSETPSESYSAHEMQVAKERLETVICSMKNELDQLLTKRDELLEKLFEESQQG